MHRDDLSKEEIDVLLRPMIDAVKPIEIPTPPKLARQMDAGITEEHLSNLHRLHQPMAARVEGLLTDDTGSPVSVSLSSVEVSTYADFVFSRPIPSCFAKLHCQPQSCFWVIDIEYEILFSLIDCLLGGPSKNSEKVQRPLTEIERRLTRRVIKPWLTAIEEAWEPVQAVELELDSIHHNPQQQRVIPPSSSIIWLTFHARVEGTSGPIEFCIPTRSVKRIVNRIASGGTTPQDELIELTAHFTGTILSSHQLDQLQVGDVLSTDIPEDQPLTVSIDGTPTHLAAAGALHGHKAIKLVARIS